MDTKIHLCDNCIHEIPTCDATDADIEYGDGFGNDNVIKCKCFVSESGDQ